MQSTQTDEQLGRMPLEDLFGRAAIIEEARSEADCVIRALRHRATYAAYAQYMKDKASKPVRGILSGIRADYNQCLKELERRVSTCGLRGIFGTIHDSSALPAIGDNMINHILGMHDHRWERELMGRWSGGYNRRQPKEFDNEFTGYGATGYHDCRRVVHSLNPQPHDVVYDLGCGYGRFVIYGALATKAMFKGVELVPERVQKAEEVRARNRIENAGFACGNVLETGIGDGTMFYMFNPFSDKTLRGVTQILERIARERQIKVVAIAGAAHHLREPQWCTKAGKWGPFFMSKP